MKAQGVNFPIIEIGPEVGKVSDFVANTGISITELTKESKLTYAMVRKSPFLLKDMDKLVERMLEAFHKQEKIVVFGDYDVDGISGTAVMKKGLEYLGFQNVDIIAPTRDTGYSIRREYVEDYISTHSEEQYPNLIVTVDCGIKSAGEIKFISEKMMIDIIVTDHHLPDKKLPESAIAVVDPHREDSEYPFRPMSGSFVALKVIEAINEALPFVRGPISRANPDGNPGAAMNELQELATLGIVADMMPIIGENRVMVREIMPRYIFSNNLGIQTFTKHLVNQKANSKVGPDLIGWQIGPRINAAKRVGNSTIPLEMLLSDDQEKVETWFTELENINSKRKVLMEEEKIRAFEVMDPVAKSGENILVYVEPSCAEGIIGLVAGKLKEAYYIPTIVLGGYSEKKGELKGSCRSVEGVHILNILEQFKEYLVGYGGHAMAAGFSIKAENVEAFVNAMYQYCRKNVKIDGKKTKSAGFIRNYSVINTGLLNVIELMGPFGMGNEAPKFVVLGKITATSFMGTDKQHAKIKIENSNRETVDCVCFNFDKKFYDLPALFDEGIVGSKVGILGTVGLNEFNGNVSKQVMFDDIIFID